MKKILSILFILFHLVIFAQEEFHSKTIWYDFKSDVFDSERKISIYLPASYFEKNTENFVVCYLLDGQFEPYFKMVCSMMDYYSISEESIPLIVVSIHTDNRWEEFTTQANRSRKVSAETLSKHLSQEVIPYIDKNYRTEKFKLGVGHSLGGSYLMYEIFKSNSIFNGIIAASPNMNYEDEILVKQGKNFVKSNPNFQRYVYANVGTEGEVESFFNASIVKLDSLIKDNSNWIFDILKDENHMTTFIKAFDKGIITFSKQWNISKEKLNDLALINKVDLAENVKTLFLNHSIFIQKEIDYSIDNLSMLAKKLKNVSEFDCSVAVIDLALELFEIDSIHKKKEILDDLSFDRMYNSFYALSAKAKGAFLDNDFKLSSDLYLKSFETGAKNGTHMERIESMQAFAQNGDIEEAFKQLDLLANYFECRGSYNFVSNAFFEPLKLDPRWNKLMEKLDENLKL